ncbi:permease [Sphaerochaeta halotolerans]|jgi:uncharacterized membrane protein YraQ (UPF0718 family)|uniref:Permease n=1 Tax=Sphaerochaeta halotolerans TaxID=2293840 RepID=A0A372MFB5_9SPIR|nr:permease [Sphaerochaeta halotolerans]MBG0766868.1 permease [Spirochaetaceae bacterium]MDK2860079.1 uncharacterized protein [Sphaerochaeta sp.]MDN5334927.1 uncharacterized protein [Sphaerochaeta sp.]MXI86701.1 permease [Sphaerochaeta halotolerans]RFU94469.1 permease [Sphaerochaeta halotolerans]
MNTFWLTLRYFVTIMLELTVLFIAISAIVALMLTYISRDRLSSWLTRRGLGGNILGAIVGSLTPFCACSTIPMTLGMLQAGAPFGSVMSFVIASPLLNPIIIVMLVTLMGWNVAAVYFIITFVGAVLFGASLQRLGFSNQVKSVRIKNKASSEDDDSIARTFKERLAKSIQSAWNDYKAVFRYLLIGVAVGSMIYGYIPEEFIVRIAGPDNLLSVPIAATIGVPLYIRAETAIPIGLGLVSKGMGLGTVVALIIGGSGMAIPEISMLAGIFKRKLVGALVVGIWLTAVVGGYLFNILA